MTVLLAAFSATDWLTYALILFIVVWQVKLWLDTRAKISEFAAAIPDVAALSIVNPRVLSQDVREKTPSAILANLPSLEARCVSQRVVRARLNELTARLSDPDTADFARRGIEEDIETLQPSLSGDGAETELTILACKPGNSAVFTPILDSINTYLLRNKGAVADFNLIRDIINRNLDAREEGIGLALPTPLYLGLLGTMLGIVLGLFAMPDVTSEAFLQGEGITTLLSGVRAAMLASAAGLLLTVLNSLHLRQAKAAFELRRHALFTLLQTELLPVLSQSLNAGLFSTLNQSIERFSRQFQADIGELGTLVRTNHGSLMAQQKALDTLEKMDLNRLATYNVQVLTQLDGSLAALQKFGAFLQNLNGLVDNTARIVDSLQGVEALGEQIGRVLDESREMQRYFRENFQQIEKQGFAFKNRLEDFDSLISDSLTQLGLHVQARLKAVEEIKYTQERETIEYFEKNRARFDKLDYLERLHRDTAAYQQHDAQIQANLEGMMAELADRQTQTAELMARLVERMEKSAWGRLLPARSNGQNAGPKA